VGTTSDGVGRYRAFHYVRGGGRNRIEWDGAIYWTPRTCAHEVHGVIHEKWNALGRESGPLGYPTTNETVTHDGRGRYNRFERGSIYWTPSTGARAVAGDIHALWTRLGYEQSALGYPATDEEATPDGRGRRVRFEHGSIESYPGRGARVVR
jgi:uncharacterized protein with LGFP repeats